MARRPNYDPFDFSNPEVFNNNPEAVANRQRYLTEIDPRNREAKAWAFIKALVDDGVELSDEDQIKILNDFIQTGNTTYIAPPDFSNVESRASEFTPETGLDAVISRMREDYNTNAEEIGALGNKLGASVRRAAGGSAILAADNPDTDLVGLAGLPAGIPGLATFAGRQALRAAGMDLSTPIDPEAATEFGTEQFAKAAEQDNEANQVLEKAADRYDNELWRQYVEGVGDAAGSWSSFLSIIGGPTAAATFADIYLQEYGQARLAGLSPEEAHAAAAGQATPETALSLVPTQRVLSKVPVIGQGIDRIEKRLLEGTDTPMGKMLYAGAQTAQAVVGEGGQEAIAFAAQDAVRRYQGLVGEGRAREYALEQVVSSENYTQELWRNARAGILMGGAFRAPTAAVEASRAGEAILSHNESAIENILVRAAELDNANRRAFNSEIDAREQERIRIEEEKTRAFEQAEAERELQREQEELEREAGFQTIERGNVGETSRVERYGGVTGRTEAVPGSPAASGAGVVERVPVGPAREVRPEDVAAQREEAARQERERKERAEQGKRIEAIRKRQEAAKKRQESERKKQEKVARTRQAKIIDELIAENPDATPQELEAKLQARMAVPAEPTPDQKLADTQGTPTQQKAATETPAQPAPTPKPAAPKPAITKPDREITDQEVDDIVNYFSKMVPVDGDSLGMADSAEDLRAAGRRRRGVKTAEKPAEKPAEKMPEIDMDEYRKTAKRVARALVRRGGKGSKSVQQLMLSGKLIAVPSATSVGRTTNNVAEYSIDTGQLFIYTDKIDDPDNGAAFVARALHEATHAGQFNDREGRSNLYRQFLGDRRTSEAAAKIRKAAANGNKIAKAALAAAQRDTESRRARGEANPSVYEDLEVVGYFTSEVVKSRGTALGSVGGVVRDITTAARSFLRDKLNLDLELSIGDLYTAAMGVGFEIANTDLRGLSSNPDVLGMIYNIDPDNLTDAQRKAIDNGYVYDSVDGNKKYVLTDENSSILPDAVEKLRDANGPVRMAEVLDHPVLYENSPEAADLPVYATDIPLGDKNTMGVYMPSAEEVYINSKLLDDPDSMRGTLLHEIQHFLQDRAGLSHQFYDGNDLVAKHKELLDELEVRTKALDDAASRFLDTAPDYVSRAQRQDIMRSIMRNPDASDTAKAALVRDYILGLPSPSPKAMEAVEQYEAARKKYNEFIPQFRESAARVHADYLANITEREAHFTQYNKDNPTTGINPEPIMREQEADPETGEDPTGGRIDVPIGNGITIPMSQQAQEDPTSTPQDAERAEAAILGMAEVSDNAENFDPVDSTAFKRWFRNSQLVNSDGSPKVHYHGTTFYFDAFMPNSLGLIFVSPSRMFAESFAGLNNQGYHNDPIPLYVRAENVWDYQNPEHVDQLMEDPEVAEFVNNYYNGLLSPEESRKKLAEGDWSIIENPIVVERIKELGYDSLTVYERENKNIAVFSPNQLKHATDNSGEFSESPNYLGMDAGSSGKTSRRITLRAIDAVTPDNKYGEWLRDRGYSGARKITGLFRNDAALGNKVLQAFEHAKSSPAGYEAKGNASLGKYEKALHRLAVQQGKTFDELAEQIREELDAADNPEFSYTESLAAWEDVLSKYGEAGQHLLDLRNQVDKMSIEMLRQLYDSGQKVSPSVAQTYAAIGKNLGRYSHRMYAAYMGDAGRKYAKSTMRAWRKVHSGKSNPTPAQLKAAAVVDRAIDVLVNNNLLIPDDAKLANLSMEALRTLYGTWGDFPSSNPSQDAMIEELAAKRDSINGDTDRLQRTAEEIVKDLLGLLDGKDGTVVGNYYRGGKQDLTIMEHRSRIPVEIRTLLGEITEPGTRLLATIAKQSEFIARTNMHEELKRVAEPRDLQPPSATGTQIVVDNDMTRLEGAGFGSLEGWYASPNMRALLDDIRESTMTLEQAATIAANRPDATVKQAVDKVVSAYTGAAATSKALQIVGNAILYPINGLGAVSSLVWNGNVNPKTWALGARDAAMVIGYAMNPRLGLGDAEIPVKYGVTDNATVGEFRSIPYRKLQEAVREMSGESNIVRWAKRMYNTGKLTLPEIYAMTDVWAKIANFHNEVNFLRDFYKKNGEQRTDDEIYREAAEKTKRTNITWQRAMPLMKVLERGGITHFGVYFYEVFRSEVYNVAEGIRELAEASKANNAAAGAVKFRRGMQRLAGQVAVWTFWGQLTKSLNEFVFGDDEEEARKRRWLLPDFMQNQDLYPMGLGKNGLPVLFAVSRVDPKGPIVDIMREALVGGSFDADKAKETFLDLYVKPRLLPRLVDAYNAVDDNQRVYRTPVIKELFPRGYGYAAEAARYVMKDNTFNAFVNAAEAAFTPGTLNAYRSFNPDIVAPHPDIAKGDAVAVMASMAKYMGATFVQPQPDDNMKFAARDYNKQVKDNRQDLLAFFGNTPDADVGDVSRKMLQLIADEREQWDKMHRVYQGMVAYGMKQEDIEAILTNRVTEKRARTQIRTGVFEPISISRKSIETAKQNELKGKTEEEKKEIEARWKAILGTFEAAQGAIK